MNVKPYSLAGTAGALAAFALVAACGREGNHEGNQAAKAMAIKAGDYAIGTCSEPDGRNLSLRVSAKPNPADADKVIITKVVAVATGKAAGVLAGKVLQVDFSSSDVEGTRVDSYSIHGALTLESDRNSKASSKASLLRITIPQPGVRKSGSLRVTFAEGSGEGFTSYENCAFSNVAPVLGKSASGFELWKEKAGPWLSHWFDRCEVDGAPTELLQSHPYDQMSDLEVVYENKPGNTPLDDTSIPILDGLTDYVKFDKTPQNIEVDPSATRITIKDAVWVRKGQPDETISILVDRSRGEMVYRGAGASRRRVYSRCEYTSPAWDSFLRLSFKAPFLDCGATAPEWSADGSAFPTKKLFVTDSRGVRFELPFLGLFEEDGGVEGLFKVEGRVLKSGSFRYGGEDAILTLMPRGPVTRAGLEANVTISSLSGKELLSRNGCRVDSAAFASLNYN